MSLSRLQYWHRVILGCSTLIALAGTTVAPIPAAALSGITHTPMARSSVRPGLTSDQLAQALRSGYWHTEGNRIVSDFQTTVRISGANWSGFETKLAVPGGLEHQDYHVILRTVIGEGYNTLRIPLSNQAIEHPGVPSAIRFENEGGPMNTDLKTLNSLQILDHIVLAAGELGLKVILDDHRSEAGSTAEENGLWYTAQYPEEAWIADWVALTKRYKSNSTVIGFDIRNEPHNATTTGACWDCGGTRDWHLAAERAGNAILAVNPNVLIFVEGTDVIDGSFYWWGGNLMGVRRSPVQLNVPNRLVYSAHLYGPTEYQQPWFNSHTTHASLIENFHKNWGYISESGLAPVWIGEFGVSSDEVSLTSIQPGSEGQWFNTLISYLQQQPTIGWSYWALNGEDHYSLLNSSYDNLASLTKSHLLASVRRPRMRPLPLSNRDHT